MPWHISAMYTYFSPRIVTDAAARVNWGISKTRRAIILEFTLHWSTHPCNWVPYRAYRYTHIRYIDTISIRLCLYQITSRHQWTREIKWATCDNAGKNELFHKALINDFILSDGQGQGTQLFWIVMDITYAFAIKTLIDNFITNGSKISRILLTNVIFSSLM